MNRQTVMQSMSLQACVAVAKKLTAVYARTHKGRSLAERTCIRVGYLIAIIEGRRRILALTFNTVKRRGEFVIIR